MEKFLNEPFSLKTSESQNENILESQSIAAVSSTVLQTSKSTLDVDDLTKELEALQRKLITEQEKGDKMHQKLAEVNVRNVIKRMKRRDEKIADLQK